MEDNKQKIIKLFNDNVKGVELHFVIPSLLHSSNNSILLIFEIF